MICERKLHGGLCEYACFTVATHRSFFVALIKPFTSLDFFLFDSSVKRSALGIYLVIHIYRPSRGLPLIYLPS